MKIVKSRNLLLMSLLLFMTLLTTCKKDPENPSGSNKFEYGQTTIDSVSYRELIISTQISNLGGNTVVQYGHCWDIASKPDINDSLTMTSGNPQNLEFTSNLTNLNSAKKYFVRAYCKLANTTVYSDEIEVTTLKTGKPLVVTMTISDITISSARCEGKVTADSGLVVIEKGVIWDTVQVFDVSSGFGKMIGGTGTGQFSCQLNNLQEGKNYYIKAYATNQAGTGYGELMNFQTTPITLPEVSTTEITQITTNSAQSGGEVINSGNGNVSLRGICWGADPGVMLGNCIDSTQEGSGIGNFTSAISGLQDGIFYYVKAYATNEKGTAYGEERSFQTVSINLPTVTTAEVTNVTSTSAKCGGNVVNSGNGTVTARGVCWGLNSDITLQNCQGFTTNGSGTGSFTSNVTGLTAGNTYFVRAYATNENGTGYGATKIINTPSIPEVITAEITSITPNTAISGGTVAFDGFGTVSGRGICWGSSPNPTIGNCIGFTNNGSGMGSFTSNLTNLSPSTLYYVRAYATNETGMGYGDLKSFYTTAIGVPTVITENITNITTTTATGGGNVTDNGAGTVLSRGICWGNQPNPTLENAIGYTNNGSGDGSYVSQMTGLSPGTLYYVRAYATNEAGTGYGDQKSFITLSISLPDVITGPVSLITTNSARTAGQVMSEGNGTVTARGVCWNTSPNPTLDNNIGFTLNGSGLGIFYSNIVGLSPGTLYYVCAYATNEVGTGYGDDKTFTTLNDPCDWDTTLTYEGHIYGIVSIGNQCWFKEDLNIGTRIDGSMQQTDNSIIEKYCYNDLVSNCDIYGGLYQWDEMMQYITAEGVQGICPDGWHLPTDAELTALTTYLGGDAIAGGPLKEAGTAHWLPPNSGATNSSGFTALPGGWRNLSGVFADPGSYGHWWSSSQYSTGDALYRDISYNGTIVRRFYGNKEVGFQVRCIKNTQQ
jgi:uncharacterized protein (TIGR02145 family)